MEQRNPEHTKVIHSSWFGCSLSSAYLPRSGREMLPIIVKHRIPEHPEGRPKRGAWNSPLHLCTGGFVTPEHLSQAPALPFPSPALHRMQLGLELLGHLLLLGWLESSVKAGATHTQQNPSSCPRDPCQLILPAPGAARDSSNFCKTRPGPSSWLQIRGWEIRTNPARLCKGLGWDGIGWDQLPALQSHVQPLQTDLWLQAAPILGFLELLLAGTLVPG